jgi:hypothetical protein
LVGSVVKWQTTTNTSSGSFTDISNTTTSLTHTVSSSGTHYFRSVVNTNACSTSDIYSDWYPIVATTGSTPVGGEVSSQSHCSVDNSGTLELSGATGGTFNWQISTNNGGSWANTSPVNTSLIHNYANITRNTLFRVQVSNGCNSANSSSGSITIYGTNKCQWTGASNSDWGTSSNWCNGMIASNGSDFDISLEATNDIVLDLNRTIGTVNFNGSDKYIYLGNYNLFLTDMVGSDTSNHIKTDGTGVLIARIDNNDSFTFNIGAGSFNPVTITNKTGTTDDFEVRVIDDVYNGGTSGSSLYAPRVKRTWFIDKVGGSANSGTGIDMSFNWYLPEEAGTISAHRLYHHSGTDWDIQTSGTYSTRTRYLIYRGYMGTFSPFAIGDGMIQLPVELISFNAEGKSNTVNLSWITESENNHSHFVVMRSKDGKEWEEIGVVNNKVNSQGLAQYELIDTKPYLDNYYQLKIVDNEGNSKLSDIRYVQLSIAKPLFVLSPNPTSGVVKIQTESQDADYRVYDLSGKVLHQGILNKEIELDNLSSGIYFIKVMVDDRIEVKKLIIE